MKDKIYTNPDEVSGYAIINDNIYLRWHEGRDVDEGVNCMTPFTGCPKDDLKNWIKTIDKMDEIIAIGDYEMMNEDEKNLCKQRLWKNSYAVFSRSKICYYEDGGTLMKEITL